MASYEWLRGFMNRNQQLSLRTSESTSLSRGTAFNKHTVGEFYDLLAEVLHRDHFGPDSIYNCDETGVQTIHKPAKIISLKGQKQVPMNFRYSLSSHLLPVNEVNGSQYWVP